MKRPLFYWLTLAAVLSALLSCRLGAPAAPTPASDFPTEPYASSTPDTRPPAAAQPSAALPANPGGHPRLWLTPALVTRLQGWAVESNPLWRDGLLPLAEAAKAAMQRGDVPGKDCGGRGYEDYPTEMYAELFAFLSLVEPQPAARADYAARARSLLMHVMNEAAKGPASAQNFSCAGSQGYPPFRHPEFYTSDTDRARWHGEAYPLVVDWIYPSLSAQDKATILQVFTRWANDIVTAGYHHPEPAGPPNSPTLLADRAQVRWSGNNYFTAHMRNLGLMAMALDPADDPGLSLHAYLDTATGVWLYLFDHLTRTDSAGGLLPEGFEYSPQTAAYAIQFLLALHTAGQDDPALRGPQVSLAGNPFWDDLLIAYFHSLSPAATVLNDQPDLGPVYQPSFYGDTSTYSLSDFIDAFGALGLYDQYTGSLARLEALRWAERQTPAGGPAGLLERLSKADEFRHAILYFTLFDPGLANAADPRPGLPLDFFAPGMHKLFSRTSWGPEAAWFIYTLSWNQIDHQQADGNHFEFYRAGEWLTKARNGYADTAEGIASSEFRNLPAIQNNNPGRDPGDYRTDLWMRGSQWNLNPAGDPALLAHSAGPLYTYALGDATNLYNDSAENAADVRQAVRSILWLKPDFIVVYDRLASQTPGRFKRWWLQLPTPAQVSGRAAKMTTARGQQLFVSALLPTDAVLTSVPGVEAHIAATSAAEEPMTARLEIEAPGGPLEARFLTVLQGADPGASPAPASLLRSADGAFEGARIGGQALVLFPLQVGSAPSAAAISYSLPEAVRLQIITGLAPGASYHVQVQNAAAGQQVTVAPAGENSPGVALTADSGGVLVIQP